MPKKYDSRREAWNHFFAGEIAEFCDTNKIRFTDRQIGLLWAVCISDKVHHLPAIMQEGLHIDFFTLFTRHPDDALVLLREMRRLHNRLSRAKRAVLTWGTVGQSDDEIAARIAKFWPRITAREIAEAREWVAKRQATRRIQKNSE